MKTLDVAALALNAGLYAALGYVLYYILPLTAPGFGTVRFWPSVVVPAVFAVLFGPWVGGAGAGIGIFISDMLIHGNPVLSLMAGVPSNFAMFALIGYVTKKNIDWKIPMAGCGVLAALLVWIAYYVLSADLALFFSAIIVGSYLALAVLIVMTPRWRGFEVGSTLGLLVGSSIIGFMVPLFSQFFLMPGSTQLTPLSCDRWLYLSRMDLFNGDPLSNYLRPTNLAGLLQSVPRSYDKSKGNHYCRKRLERSRLLEFRASSKYAIDQEMENCRRTLIEWEPVVEVL